MSVKTTLNGIVALTVAAAAMFYFFGRGGKLETSRDKSMTFIVEFDPRVRSHPVIVLIEINGAESRNEPILKSPYRETLWIRPGERATLEARQGDEGHILCTIIGEGETYGPDEAGPDWGAACKAEMVG